VTWRIALGVLQSLLAPAWALVTALHPRTRGAWPGRWALRLPAVAPGAVWVHGASVGEGRAAEALFGALGGSSRVLLRTASTDTGLQAARGHHVLAPRPVDVPWVVGRWLDRVRPRVLVLVESELWPALLFGCRARGIPVVVAGARQGRGTRRLRRWLPGLFEDLADCVALWLARAPGLDVPGPVQVVGDPKLGPVATEPVELARPALVAGSTREGEEEVLLDAWAALDPRPLLVLAPRHPERFEEVASLLGDRGLAFHRWSQGSADLETPEVLLVDTVGDLVRFYPRARAAFVGGTLSAAVGGHSPAEAVSCGLPVVRGPHGSSNVEAYEGARVFEATGAEALAGALARALEAGPGEPVAADAPARIAAALGPYLDGPIPPERPHRPLLAPFALLWSAVVRVRSAWWTLRRPARVGVPVISVGGLGSGGVGKTPVVAALVERLVALGRTPAVVARGYRRRGPGGVRTGHRSPDAAWLGDELAMLAQRGVPVVSAPDRVAGARAAVAEGADVLVLDDGFQHRALHRDLDVVVVDGRHPTEGGPLPMGEGREGLAALARADLVWCMTPGAGPETPAGLARVRAARAPTGWLRNGEELPLGALAGQEVVAFAAVARPGRFLEDLVAAGCRVRGWHTARDHHPWTPEELAALARAAGARPLVCTEKDLARLPPDFEVNALRFEVRVLEGEATLDALLEGVLA